MVDCEEAGRFGIQPYIPEPDSRWERVWSDKPEGQRRAVYNNRKRTSRDYGKRLQRRRSEVVERTFAHTCDTGGARRTWLRGVLDVGKRYLMQAAAHNLGVLLRKLLGAGKPREFWALDGAVFSLGRGLWAHFKTPRAHREQNIAHWFYSDSFVRAAKTLAARLARRWQFSTCSTGC